MNKQMIKKPSDCSHYHSPFRVSSQVPGQLTVPVNSTRTGILIETHQIHVRDENGDEQKCQWWGNPFIFLRDLCVGCEGRGISFESNVPSNISGSATFHRLRRLGHSGIFLPTRAGWSTVDSFDDLVRENNDLRRSPHPMFKVYKNIPKFIGRVHCLQPSPVSGWTPEA